MKKLTSLLLVFAIALSCFVFVGCDTEDKLGFFKERKIKKDYIEQFGIQEKNIGDVVLDYYGGNYNGYEIVMLDAEWHDPKKWVEQLGGYSITYYDSNRLYAYKDGVFFTLSEAYNNGYIDSIKEISISWQSDIGGYKDTCDKYDFDKWTSNPTYDELEYKALLISIDKRISGTIPEKIEYLGSNLIKEMYIEFPDADIRGDYAVYVAVLTIPTKIWAEYAMKEISKIPGVLLVEHYHTRSMAVSFANDTYYTHNGSWWINNIEIEKVWNFRRICKF